MSRSISYRSCCAITLVLICALPGCNRAHYRKQADQEVYSLVGHASSRLDRPMPQGFTIEGDPKSRFFDPSNPDCPPMPPDDPLSHTYMECVDGKRGYPCWDANGTTRHVENPDWRRYLPQSPDGQIVMNRELAYQAALINSPEYQRALENVYLSALKVTEERFEFDVKFYGGNSTFYEANGRLRGGDTTLSTRNTLGMRRRFATGSQLAVDVANSFVWQFAGPDRNAANTLINFNFVQPLLRYGGRDYVLENLTESERALLANIRQFERFRRGFYTQVIAGGGNVGIPSGGTLGIQSGRSSGSITASGYLGLLQEQIRIRNQKANITGLQDSLYRLVEMFRAGQLQNSLQVEQARQQLLNSQTRLLSLNNAYENRLDTFKMTLGLPPDLPVVIKDPLLDQFELIDPRLTQTQDHLNQLLKALRDSDVATPPGMLHDLGGILLDTTQQLVIVRDDIDRLDQTLPKRIRNLEMLANRPEIRDGNVDRSAVDVSALRDRVRTLHELFPEFEAQIALTLEEGSRFASAAGDPDLTPDELDVLRKPVLDMCETLSNQLMMLSLMQARARLDTLTLVPIDLSPERALEIASENRRDWMNARAALVTRWRQIEVRADALESDLDIIFDGRIDTVGNNPAKFRSSTGSLGVGLRFDAPLTRLIERNNYRRALIDYQLARREFYGYRDGINQSLRSTLRAIRLSQINFELQRAAVLVAIVKVDLAQENLMAPPEKGQTSANSNLARDVTDALQQLLSAQNDFLTVWVDYQAQRMTLDLDLGTMELDGFGTWVDPGPILESQLGAPSAEGPAHWVEPELQYPRAGLDEIPPGLEDRAILPPGFAQPLPEGLPLPPPSEPHGAIPPTGTMPMQAIPMPAVPMPVNPQAAPAPQTAPAVVVPEPSAALIPLDSPGMARVGAAVTGPSPWVRPVSHEVIAPTASTRIAPLP